jgi:hypothetical protein
LKTPLEKLSIGQKLRNVLTTFRRPITIPVSQRHVLIISAFVKDGIVTASWNGKFLKAKFDDNSLRNMMYDKNFQDNYFSMMGAAAQMVQQLIKK